MNSLELEYGHLAEGDSVGGQVCPECNGGRTGEKSLRVSRYKGRLRAKCYRASCGWTYVSGQASFSSAVVQKPKELRHFLAVNNRPLNDVELDKFSDKFHIERGMFEWAQWTHVDDFDNGRGPRIVMPILGPEGRVRGKTYRSWEGHLPKAQINKLVDEQMICWYKPAPYGKVLVVVEDQPSALRIAAAGVDSLALCGTEVTAERMQEIKRQKYNKVFICLDDDALAKAVKIVAEWRLRMANLKVKHIDVDVKNMTPDKFAQFVQEVKDD